MVREIQVEATKSAIARLQVVLSDLSVLYTKVRNFHWNVEGANFKELHEYFEELYTSLAEHIDEVAETIRMRQDTPVASMAQFLELAHLTEVVEKVSQKEMLTTLISDYEHMLQELKNLQNLADKEDDILIDDLSVSLTKEYEKVLWFLRSYNK